MKKKKLSILTFAVAVSLCTCSKIASAAPHKILTFTNMPVWDYHQTNYDKDGNMRISPRKTTFNLNGKEKKASYIPMFKVKEIEVKSPITISCELKTEDEKGWFKNINKVTKEDSTKNPNLEQVLEFEKSGDNLVIKGNQRALDNNGVFNIKVHSKNHDSAIIPVNIVQAEPIKVLVSYPMNPRTGEDIRFKLENFNYAVINPVNKVFLTHNNKRKELVKFNSYHPLSDSITIYAKDDETGEGNLLQAGEYTLEIYADGFKKVEKKFEVIKNDVKSTGKNNNKKSETMPLLLKSNKSNFSSIDTLSTASVSVGKASDNSGSEESSGGSVVMHSNLVYDHDLLANALILKELGMGTTESESIADRFELNTISYDAVISKDGTHINDFEDYLNSVKDAALNGEYLTYDNYISNKNAKEYKNRPYNVKEVLEDNLLGQAKGFKNNLGLEAPKLDIKSSIMNKDMIIKCDDTNYLNNITAITLKGDGRELEKDLYSIKGNELIINNKLTTGDKIQLRILAKGYKDKIIETKLEKHLDKVELKLEKDFKTGENVIITGLTSDFIKNIKTIKLDDKSLLTKEQGGDSSNTYYTIKEDKLILQGGLFKEGKDYNLEIEGKYYGKKNLTFTVEKIVEKPKEDVPKASIISEKNEIPKMNFTLEKQSMFMKQYDVKINGDSKDWLKKINKVSVNGVNYENGMQWQNVKDRFSVYAVDNKLSIGYEGFKTNENNVITIESEGYKDFVITISKNGKILENK